jgi:anti-sigma B factor antagonist
MTIQDTPQGDTVVLDISGKVTIGYDAKVREGIAEALDSGAENILLNMRQVSKLDSSGVGELVAAHNHIQNRGGRLLLVGLPSRLATVLQITNLLGVLELYDDVEAALRALDTETD